MSKQKQKIETLDLFEISGVPIEEMPLKKRKTVRACEVEEAEAFTAKEVIAIRKEMKLSQETFARLLGVKRPSLSHWEHGDRDVPDMICRLLVILRDDPDYFFQRGVIHEIK
ncbi:helix-turn-helix domain-containing protein [Sporolactobacillus sp. KGMB 08714]|uniref:helix-turn-helix domain-containing protein n=1 Tax=Sporolactobacillus sp. KGMB 08714 TaxID=3064704 RepID=UPI002FBDB7CA